ncbi:alcohol dehydrogenase [Sulfolobus sp. A20]|uniref:iron-containing alcohol dehydrogenase n=1 Tax=Sulfolobaceae TaxID=118883 RepID=UPI000845C576|nr:MULTISPECIES: iron-containing alcohol dehydrogenase [unclassified Sulfolobus]TRM75271.1 alcohol dehydrogenase [Sulfolobus sp. E5]TRM77103.1 alcohol dehydrogenase [Sulfolobus sp. A20-N-F8]TRM78912.1 alcohol dehydrogenase [Sulfolobus sp. B5]TRM86737.1 alcohol dehydrogenase [Sulfolobus sp. E3]TRM91117.1 alcohol dehydrogenase [Sulfolobus sp. A20-N-G8]TRM99073.1 alcohol dehydrogenase [Sulfolobus sp. E1]
MYKLNYPTAQVIYGYDALEWLINIKEKKVALVTTRSLLKSKILSEVLKLVSANVIEGPRQHVPESDLNSLYEKLKGYETVIGLGGGSIIDGIKLVTDAFYIAIPTTLSGAEHTRSGGYTVDGVKSSKLGKDADVIILDPRATLETPKWLLVTSGVRSLDHAIEALYSTQSTPFTDTLAIEGYKKLINCLRNLESLEDRLNCQIGSWLSSITMRYVKMGMSHMFGYVFGPRFNIPHGVTSCISLPTAVKFNYEIAKHKLKEIEDGEPLYISINNFLKEIGVRKRLSEFVPSLEDALKYAKVYSELVNNSGNPLKVDLKMAEDFIKEVY